MAHYANSPCGRYLRPRFGRRRDPSAGKYFSANLPSRLRSGPPQLRQSNSRSFFGGVATRTNLYGASQVGQWNAIAFSKQFVLAMMLPPAHSIAVEAGGQYLTKGGLQSSSTVHGRRASVKGLISPSPSQLPASRLRRKSRTSSILAHRWQRY
jgi:hypothetical protein